MTDDRRDAYLLDRGGLASTRLMFQHYTLTRMQGWLLHPNVEASISDLEKPRIADLATGNAIWAYDVAERYPNAEVYGFDISAEQFPPKITWPSTVTLELGDLFDPVPEKYQQYFDVIHIRLIVAAIYTMDKDRLMKNVLAMIKPGGYLQWDEIIAPCSIIVDKDLNAKYEMTNFWKHLFNVSNFGPATQWAVDLPDIYKQYGLENVVGHKPPLKPAIVLQQFESIVWSCREVMELAIRQGKPRAKEEYDLAMQDLDNIRASGGMVAYAWMVTIGRKPLASG